MADWSIVQPCAYANYTATATPSSTNVKSSWVELIGSAPFSGAMFVNITTRWKSGYSLTDIGVGAAGNEQTVIENLLMARTAQYWQISTLEYPFLVQKGQRIAVRSQTSQSAYKDFVFGAQLRSIPFSRGFNFFAGCDTYGASTGDSQGTDVTKGNWTQICASTSRAYKGIIISLGVTSAWSDGVSYVDVGLGETPANNLIVENYQISADDAGDYLHPSISPIFYVNIPVSTKISVLITEGSGTVDGVIHCLY